MGELLGRFSLSPCRCRKQASKHSVIGTLCINTLFIDLYENLIYKKNMKFFENSSSFIDKKSWYYLAVAVIFIFAISIRTYLFMSNGSFEDDECRLILTLLGKNIGQVFLPLGEAQSAPPIFLIIAKLLAYLFGYKEYILKFIPFVCSIASLFVFYKITAQYFEKKVSVLLALLIFSLIRPFLAFSAIFKQYSSDVLICLLCLYYLPRLNIASLSLKRTVITAAAISLIPFISLPAVFFIGGWGILNFINNIKKREFYIRFVSIFIPFGLLMFVYYIINLHPSQVNLLEEFPGYWNDGFFDFSLRGFLQILTTNFKYNFYPNIINCFSLGLLLWGAGLCFFDNSSKNCFSKYILYTLGLILLASLLHLYPFVGRVALYFTPCLIILFIKPLDYYKFKSYTFVLALLCFVLGFYQYNYNYFKDITNSEFFYTHSAKNLMRILKEKFNPQDDIILSNTASASSYLFYSSSLHFKTDNVYLMISSNEYFDNIKKGQKIWIYMVKDFAASPIYPYVFEWLKDKQIFYYKKERDSYLIYLKN